MDYKKIAEEYVINHCGLKELSFGCEVQPYGVNSPECRYVIASRFTKAGRYFCTGVHERANPKQALFSSDEIKFVFGHPILPHHWLKALRSVANANWMLASVGDNFELIDMTSYNSPKFKNRYMIIGHENFYRRFCEELNLV